MKSAPAIALDYRPSRLLALAMAAMTAIAITAALLSGLAFPWRLLAAVLAGAFGCFVLVRHLRPRFSRIAHGAGGWILVDGEAREHPVSLLAHVERGGLLVLEFGAESTARTRFLLAPDNCDADLRRRLLLVLAAGEPGQQTVQRA
ncbi:hypothetical protein [Dokdonella sp.]|uniref:hypothetical protein n=1 Tax=Dokdonella sp. TaxID=2291710 RepID=UPI00352706D0